MLGAASGSITLSKGNNPCNLQVTSKADFFKEPIVYNITDDCIYLRHATIDDNKNIVVPKIDKKTKYYHFYIFIGNKEIKLKKYDFEDDSNEDEVIIYYH